MVISQIVAGVTEFSVNYWGWVTSLFVIQVLLTIYAVTRTSRTHLQSSLCEMRRVVFAGGPTGRQGQHGTAIEKNGQKRSKREKYKKKGHQY